MATIPKIELRTGEGKRTWYAYIPTVGDWSGDMVFIDKIHYQYLKYELGDDAENNKVKVTN